tara:strand:- start:4628 stop:4873 length:246 start_codon:yes stop_codon:yes gene_type:complete
MQQQKQKRWFPKPGDLVAVPFPTMPLSTNHTSIVYGLVMKETSPIDFVGAWWDILFLGNVESLNIQIITPLWDAEGKCLRK